MRRERECEVRTALKNTRSARVRCFATPLSIIATATWVGLSVLGGSRLAIVAEGCRRESARKEMQEDKKNLKL